MSRIGKAIIEVPDSVTLTLEGKTIKAKGPKGELSYTVHKLIDFKLEENKLEFFRSSDQKEHRSLHGTSRANVANIIQGVTEGFKKELEIIGVGYRGEQKGKNINFLLGFSHPVLVEPPPGIELKMDGNTKVVITGIDKQAVGQIAAHIRSYREPEPYKGKGIRYVGEFVRPKGQFNRKIKCLM